VTGRPAGGTPGGPPSAGPITTQEKWRRTDDKQFAVISGGKLKVVNGSKTIPDPANPMDYPYLLSLPTRPDALLARVYKSVDTLYNKRVAVKKAAAPTPPPPPPPPTPEEEARNARAFELLSLYMRDAVLPRKIQAAMYGAMAKIPGVRYQPRAADLAGRPGVTLHLVANGYLRGEIIIDPKTYAYLGFHIVALTDHREPGLPPVRKGQIIGWGSLTKGVFVDKPGRRG
jgi:hypothetical protein